MKPVSPVSNNDDLHNDDLQPLRDRAASSPRDKGPVDHADVDHADVDHADTDHADTDRGSASEAAIPPSIDTSTSLTGQIAKPLETLQRRYSDQLSQDIKSLEATKARLQSDLVALQSEYEQQQAEMRSQRLSLGESQSLCEEDSQRLSLEELLRESAAKQTTPISSRLPESSAPIGPRLPGEPTDTSAESVSSASMAANRSRVTHLPMSKPSKRRRQRRSSARRTQTPLHKGPILSAIAIGLMAWHYSLVGTLGQGGSWLGLSVGELGAGFIPIVALLWLRMLVTVPALVLMAPQLYDDTWKDLQHWLYTQDRRLLLLVSSGVALFFSQALIYQCVSIVGPVLGTTLLCLYPLTAVPLGGLLAQERQLTPPGLLAMVAIAMGGVLAVRPLLGSALGGAMPSPPWLGIGASVAFSLYIVLTNLSYRRQCHPIPVGVVQFSTVAALSSLVLLVKPLRLANISWVGFVMWGLLLGLAMLLVYLFTYSSLRLVGSRAAMVTVATPLVTVLMAMGFAPGVSLEIIQWTGVLLVTAGGLALSKEKLSSDRLVDII